MIHCLCGGIPIKLIVVISSHIDVGIGATRDPLLVSMRADGWGYKYSPCSDSALITETVPGVPLTCFIMRCLHGDSWGGGLGGGSGTDTGLNAECSNSPYCIISNWDLLEMAV